MGVAFLHGNGGGGAKLNFEVKAYSSEDSIPSTEKENTFAIITDVEITSWTISAVEPESPADGAVWIGIGSISDVAFNVLEKNELIIHPVLCKQYISGEWVSMDAYIYQSGDWPQFSLSWDGYYFKDGDQYEAITGGWTTDGWNNTGTANAGETLEVNSNGAWAVARIGTAEPVDLTGVNILYYDSPTGKGSAYYPGYICVCTDKAENTSVKSVAISNAGTGSIDVSDLEGNHYLLVRTIGGQGSGAGSATNGYTSIRAIWKE